jgi:hypothetical protein
LLAPRACQRPTASARAAGPWNLPTRAPPSCRPRRARTAAALRPAAARGGPDARGETGPLAQSRARATYDSDVSVALLLSARHTMLEQLMALRSYQVSCGSYVARPRLLQQEAYNQFDRANAFVREHLRIMSVSCYVLFPYVALKRGPVLPYLASFHGPPLFKTRVQSYLASFHGSPLL